MLPKARTDRLLVTEVDARIVVHDVESRRAHDLSPVAAFVWRRADGRTPVGDLAEALSEETGVTGADELVILALKRLEYAGLLEAVDPAPRDLTRRALG